jgi:hypothetical protein
VWNPLAWLQVLKSAQNLHPTVERSSSHLSCRLQILHGTLLGLTFSYMQKTGGTPQLKLSQHSQPNCLQEVVVLWKAKTLESSCVASLRYSALFTSINTSNQDCIYLIMLIILLKSIAQQSIWFNNNPHTMVSYLTEICEPMERTSLALVFDLLRIARAVSHCAGGELGADHVC